MPSHSWPRILSDHLAPVPEPLAVALRPGDVASPRAVAARAARALLDLAPLEATAWPPWLAPHQVPAARRLAAIVGRFGGAVLADAVGLGKSYVALAVALAQHEPFALVVPAVLVPQWRALLGRYNAAAPILTHESLSLSSSRLTAHPPIRLLIVDEAHRFRNPETNRYRSLARLALGARCVLVTATPVHNRTADLFHLFRLFLRDHALAALGVPSLLRAACGASDPRLAACVAARLVVARSRQRIRGAYGSGPVPLVFPTREPGQVVRAGVAPAELVAELVAGIGRLGVPGPAAPLLRLILLRRLASSLPAFRASLARHQAFLDLSQDAARQGRALRPHEFQRLFPPSQASDIQLVLFPLLLEPAPGADLEGELALVTRLAGLAHSASDPKLEALEAVLGRGGKTIVFTDSRPTARHLMRRLRAGRRVALVAGAGGSFAAGDATRAEVLRAFAPLAQGAVAPPPALETDTLIATDLLSEGLNLQDAARVIHYDLPWSPARLAQRVGRIDRLGSPHDRIDTVSFLPAEPLAGALALEARLAAKARAQVAAGAAQVETPHGDEAGLATLDWCDRLEAVATGAEPAPEGAIAAVPGERNAVVLVIRVGALVEALVVTDSGAAADPQEATTLLEVAARAGPRAADQTTVVRAVRTAASLIRSRVSAACDARWRAADRDRLARRLIPWVLTAARRAARRGARDELAALDSLVSRLALGMTAGEEQSLEDLLARRAPLGIRDLVRWHERLPPADTDDRAPDVVLVAALVVERA